MSTQPIPPAIRSSINFFQKLAQGECTPLSFSALDRQLMRHEKKLKEQVASAVSFLKISQFEQAIEHLESRRISPLRIALGAIFFFLLFPALLAWKWHKINLALERHANQLSHLAGKVATLALISGMGKLRVEAQKLSRQLTFCAPEQATVAGAAVCEGQFKQRAHAAIQSQVLLITSLQADLQTKMKEWTRYQSSCETSAKKRADLAASAQALLQKVNELHTLAMNALQLAPPLTFTLEDPLGKPIEIEPPSAAFTTGGIENAGNSCYLASVLQLLRFQPAWHSLLNREIPKKKYLGIGCTPLVSRYEDRVVLQLMLRKIINQMKLGQQVPSCSIALLLSHMHSMKAGFAAPYKTADSPECLLWLLDKLLIETTVDANGQVGPSPWALGLQEGYILGSLEGALKPGHGLKFPVQLSNTLALHTIVPVEMVLKSNLDPQANGLWADQKLSNPLNLLMKQVTGQMPHSDLYNLEPSHPVAEQLAPYVQREVASSDLVNQVILKKKGTSYQVGLAFVKTVFVNTPPVLMISLKRFSWSAAGGKQRVQGAVEIPLTFDLAPLLSPDASVTGSTNYHFSSMIIHVGGAHGGHYYMYQRLADQSWLLCNDDSVTPVKTLDPSLIEGSFLLTYRQEEAGLGK